MNNTLLLIFFIFFQSEIYSQFSYQKESLPDSFQLADLVVNESDEIMGLWFGAHNGLSPSEFCISKISDNSISPGVKFRLNSYDRYQPVFFQSFFEESRFFLKTKFSLGPNQTPVSISSYNMDTEEIWCRYDTSDVIGGLVSSFTLDDFGNIQLVANEIDGLKLYRFDKETGQTTKRLGWIINFDFIDGSSLPFPHFIESTNTEKVFVGGDFWTNPGTFIVETNKDFVPLNRKFIKSHSLKSLKVSSDNFLYLVGESEQNFSFTKNQKNAVLVKLDTNLDVVWSKVLHAEKFEFQDVSLNFSSDGSPIVGYTTSGSYPAILAKLDKNGEIISETGYPLFTPKIDVLNDGSLLLQTDKHFDGSGNVFPKSIIAKTDSDGNISGCETYEARLQSTDIDIEMDSFGIDTSSISDMGWYNLNVEPYEFTFTDFCDLPPSPNPDFTLKDTVCVGDCIRTDSTLGNRNTQGIEWNLEGENLQLTVKDSLEFAHCFTQPGTYTLRQTIWFLGVDYSYEKIIEVLPPLSVEIVGEEILCDLPPVDLTANSNRPLRGYEWNTGDTISSTQINEGGTYWLNANDGYCYVRDERNFEFIFEKIDTSLVLNLPDSVTACEVLLPYELRPESNYSTVFENENSESNSVFLLSNSGVYEFSTEVDGCHFSKAINFKIDPCKAKIFTPSAFSPNNDGINDVFLPFSPGIEPIRLSIYDRWGGKLFKSNDSSVGWDGKRNGKISPDGVYVFRFEYVNLLTGLEEEISGDVTLVR